MEVFELFRQRQSVRAYLPKAVEEEKVQLILEAVRSAPSAGNFQPFEIYVVRKAEQIESLTKATLGQTFIAQAPVALVFCMHSSLCQYEPKDYYSLQDTTIAITFAMLAIKALGLETCWVAAFAPENIAKVLGLPAGHVPVAIMPVAYGAETPERTTRRELKEFVHEL